ncbi:GNAT family N-acetyltransferase [Glycomyces sp. NPDC047010]|uniref:GNAT family N-acetyltransferase n=1 Tax=Glycomyces sp. NPDC047010 TaxID=3155023 RepID=UPI0033F0BA0B
MPELIDPTVRLAPSFTAALHEFIAEGGGTGHSGTDTIIRNYLRPGDEWAAEYVADTLGWRTTAPPGFVTFTTLWWAEGDTFLGRLAIRHTLNADLLDVGGHIGYDVRPSARRQGHATAMLAAALPVAAALGIERALITCDADNTASRKVIEKNGGVLEDRRGDKLRYWTPTAAD